MIAAVAFDAPLSRAFDYRVPSGWRVVPGQRVRARLGAASRVGIVVAVREQSDDGLKRLEAVVDAVPALGPAALDLVQWISAQSLSSAGSTAAALVPPPLCTDTRGATSGGEVMSDGADGAPGCGARGIEARGATVEVDAIARGAIGIEGSDSDPDRAVVDHDTAPPDHRASAGAERAGGERTGVAGSPRTSPLDVPAGSAVSRLDVVPVPGAPDTPGVDVLTGAGRERRLLDELGATRRPAVVIVPDVEAAARWAQRLAKVDRVVRLDSGAGDAERAAGWASLAAGRVRLAVGTRSALLAPVPRASTLVIVDEQDSAHRPPGHPRIHAREVLAERARRDGARLILTAATPSVETWWRTTSGRARRVSAGPAPWPAVTVADTRGILRREAITPELSRALREALAAGGRAFLAVSRLASALACDECGLVVRCDACAVALAYSRAGARLECRVCHASHGLPDTCPGCRGRRLSPFGWGLERVEHAVRRRFPHARVARYEPEARGTRAESQRAGAATADVVIGTRGALRLFGPGTLALAGFVSPDQMLRVPDFRAGERLLGFLWAAAERVRANGALVIQTQHPSHPAIEAVAMQELERFYVPELTFRAELGYPPFRRVAVVTVRAARGGDSGLAELLAAALRDAGTLTVYGPAPARARGVRVVVKGDSDLPARLSGAIESAARRSGRRDTRSIMNVEVDPVEWLS